MTRVQLDCKFCFKTKSNNIAIDIMSGHDVYLRRSLTEVYTIHVEIYLISLGCQRSFLGYF